MVGLFDRDMEGWMWLGYLIETWRGGCGWVILFGCGWVI